MKTFEILIIYQLTNESIHGIIYNVNRTHNHKDWNENEYKKLKTYVENK